MKIVSFIVLGHGLEIGLFNLVVLLTPMNYTEVVGLFQSIVSSHIERLKFVHPDLFPNYTLTSVFGLFINNDTVRESTIRNHLDVLFRDRTQFVQRLVSSPNALFSLTRSNYRIFFRFANSSASTSVNSTANTSVNISATTGVDAIANRSINASAVSVRRPLGSFGDISLNEIVVMFSNFDWNILNITVYPLPLLGASIGYSLVLRHYIRLMSS